MNFKSIIVLGLSVATIGLALPAHADDTATVVNSTQDTIVTGTGNETVQLNSSRVNNRSTGRGNSGNTGTAIGNVQTSDIEGKFNTTVQVNDTAVDNYKRRTR
jgi:hypothetical protein